MVFELVLLAYATAAGFVAAGFAASLYTLVSDRPVAFPRPSLLLFPLAGALIASAVIGPFVIMRGAVRRAVAEGNPVFFIGGAALAGFWSACSGILLLDLMFAVRENLP